MLGEGVFAHCWRGCELVQPLQKLDKESFLKNKSLKRELSYDPAILLLGLHPKESKRDMTDFGRAYPGMQLCLLQLRPLA